MFNAFRRFFTTFAAPVPQLARCELRQTSRDLADPRRRAAPSMNSWSLSSATRRQGRLHEAMDWLGMVKLEFPPKRINQGTRRVNFHLEQNLQNTCVGPAIKKIIFHNNFLGEINMTDRFTTPFDGFKWFCMEKFSNCWASKLLTWYSRRHCPKTRKGSGDRGILTWTFFGAKPNWPKGMKRLITPLYSQLQ